MIDFALKVTYKLLMKPETDVKCDTDEKCFFYVHWNKLGVCEFLFVLIVDSPNEMIGWSTYARTVQTS